MITTTFITKYKPYSIDEFHTDPQLVSVVKTMMELDNLNMLFIGAPSSGKTTIVYSILRDYYGLKRDDNIPETNIMFINNLKEQGINYFRNEMKTFSQSHCSIRGKKKCIVIDDLDMINEQSQQVFRNYIDKYRHNIHFVSTCTNMQKVIESLQSRLHIVNIAIPSAESIIKVMNRIIENEYIVIDDESRAYLLERSNMSIRNVINNLEKIYIYGKPVTYEICSRLCSTISFQQFDEYVRVMRAGDYKTGIYILNELNDYGYSVIDILEYFFSVIKTTQLLSEDEKYAIVPIMCKYITVFHKIHEDCLELALFTNNVYQKVFCNENGENISCQQEMTKYG